jgi:hypothetical protein
MSCRTSFGPGLLFLSLCTWLGPTSPARAVGLPPGSFGAPLPSNYPRAWETDERLCLWTFLNSWTVGGFSPAGQTWSGGFCSGVWDAGGPAATGLLNRAGVPRLCRVNAPFPFTTEGVQRTSGSGRTLPPPERDPIPPAWLPAGPKHSQEPSLNDAVRDRLDPPPSKLATRLFRPPRVAKHGVSVRFAG